MRLVFLGPAPPFRGGIVTYQAMLYRTLEARGHTIHWSSFRQQYPRFLFPGTEQTGPTADWLLRPNTPRFVPWSPVSWWRTARDILAWQPDAVVVQFWLPFFAPGYWGVLRHVRKRTRVIAVLHNVEPHESYPLGSQLTSQALQQCHGFVAQSDQVRRDLLALLPGIAPARIATAPHPVYDFGAPGRPRKTRAQARAALGLPHDTRLVLYFGFIKPYKGVVHLIDAAPLLRARYGRDGVRVLIVGDVYGETMPYRQRIAASGAADVIELIDRFVADDQVEDYFLACDLVVLPYVSATQSGIVQIAYNYDRPVVTTDVGGLPEVVLDGKTGFVVPPRDPDALAGAVVRFFDENRAEAFAAGVAAEKARYSWDAVAAAIERLAGGDGPARGENGS